MFIDDKLYNKMQNSNEIKKLNEHESFEGIEYLELLENEYNILNNNIGLSEAANEKGPISSVISFIKKLIFKLIDFIKKGKAWLSSFYSKSSSWVKKYESRIKSVSIDKLQGKTINIYSNYKNFSPSNFNKNMSTIKNTFNKIETIQDTDVEAFKKQTKSEDINEFKAYILGEKKNINIDKTLISFSIDFLKNYNSMINAYDAASKTIEFSKDRIFKKLEVASSKSNSEESKKTDEEKKKETKDNVDKVSESYEMLLNEDSSDLDNIQAVKTMYSEVMKLFTVNMSCLKIYGIIHMKVCRSVLMSRENMKKPTNTVVKKASDAVKENSRKRSNRREARKERKEARKNKNKNLEESFTFSLLS